MAETTTATAPPASGEGAAASSAPVSGPPRRSWLGRFWLLGLLLLAATGWFLPAIVGRVASQSDVMSWVGGEDLPAEIEFDSASLSWEAPVLLHDVKIREKHGQAVANIKSVTTQQTLWQLVTQRNQPLALDLEGLSAEVIVPRSQVVDNSEAGAAEKSLDRMLKSALPILPRAVQVRLTKSELRLVDAEKQVLTVIDEIHGTYEFQPDAEQVPANHQIDLEGQVREPATQGSLQIKGEWQAAGGQLRSAMEGIEPAVEMEKLALQMKFDRIPLDALTPVAATLLQDQQLRGTLSGQSDAYFGRTPEGSMQGFIKGELAEPAALPAEFRSRMIAADGTTTPVDLGTIRWNAEASFDETADLIEVPRLELESVPLGIQGQGRVHQVRELALVDLGGSLRCDAQELLNFLPLELRQELEVQGLKITEFRAQGPLRKLVVEPGAQPELATISNEFQLSTNLSWDSVAGYGLRSELGSVKGSIDAGWLRLEPVTLPVNGGHIRMLPRVELTAESPRFELAKGVFLDRVQLTEPAVRQWLKYAAPLLANSTAVEGELSLLIAEPATGQLGHMDTADIPGIITVHQATIAPGPLLREIQDLIDQISLITGGRALPREQIKLQMAEQQIPFRVMEGRVYHKDFRLEIGDVQIGTTGSVGLDESIDLVMTIPLNDKWLQRGPILQSLQGEVIAINIGGTLDQPRLDLRPLGEFGKRIGFKAAGGLLEKILQGPPPRRRPN